MIIKPKIRNNICVNAHPVGCAAQVNTENVEKLSDIEGFREEFLRPHGFGMPGVDYSQDIRPDIF